MHLPFLKGAAEGVQDFVLTHGSAWRMESVVAILCGAWRSLRPALGGLDVDVRVRSSQSQVAKMRMPEMVIVSE